MLYTSRFVLFCFSTIHIRKIIIFVIMDEERKVKVMQLVSSRGRNPGYAIRT